MDKKSFLIGIIISAILFGSAIAWAAAQRIILLNPNESPLGTLENPLYVTNP